MTAAALVAAGEFVAVAAGRTAELAGNFAGFAAGGFGCLIGGQSRQLLAVGHRR